MLQKLQLCIFRFRLQMDCTLFQTQVNESFNLNLDLSDLKNLDKSHLSQCLKCIQYYHNVKQAALERFKETSSVDLYSIIYSQVQEMEARRLLIPLLEIQRKCDCKDSDLAEIRIEASVTLYELLKYPDTLSSSEINSLFARVLIMIQADGQSLKPPDSIFPGNSVTLPIF
jgi:hypothetical protein